MSWQIAVLAAVTGYLLGSISFARIVAGAVKPEADISRIETTLGEGMVFVSESVSATAVRMHVGTRYGCATAILDMLKVALPTLAFRLWIPDQPYFLVAAAFGLVGHDWPLYHRFKGGAGESPIYGGLLVIDPLAVLATTLIGFVAGVLAGNILILRWAGLVLLIPWLWFATGDPAFLVYILFANAVYWFAMRRELAQYFAWRSHGTEPSQEEIASEFGMGARLGRVLDRYSIPGLVSRWRQRSGRA